MPTTIDGTTGVSQIQAGAVQPDDLAQKLTSGTAINTTSGTSHDFTGIPSWVKRVTVMLKGVSVSGTSIIQLQIGAGSVDATGYAGAAAGTTNSAAVGTESALRTTGIPVSPSGNAPGDAWTATVVLTSVSANTWVFSGCVTRVASIPYSGTCGGEKTLSGTLDRIRLTTVNGTDTFDAGSVNILYE